MQFWHEPQDRKLSTTWSPTAMPLTSSPTASTMPAPSCPNTLGNISAGQEALEMDVGVAQAGGDDAHQHLVGARALEIDLVEDEVPALLVHDGDGGSQWSRSSQK